MPALFSECFSTQRRRYVVRRQAVVPRLPGSRQDRGRHWLTSSRQSLAAAHSRRCRVPLSFTESPHSAAQLYVVRRRAMVARPPAASSGTLAAQRRSCMCCCCSSISGALRPARRLPQHVLHESNRRRPQPVPARISSKIPAQRRSCMWCAGGPWWPACRRLNRYSVSAAPTTAVASAR